MFLDPESLLECSLVCSEWRALALQPRVWQRYARRIQFYLKHDIMHPVPRRAPLHIQYIQMTLRHATQKRSAQECARMVAANDAAILKTYRHLCLAGHDRHQLVFHTFSKAGALHIFQIDTEDQQRIELDPRDIINAVERTLLIK